MRYLTLLAVMLPSLAMAQAAPRAAKPPKACERPSARQVTGADRAGVRKLGEMPPAQPIYTVLRAIDGCPKPVSVRAR